jgi:hypothetical protein
MLIGVLGVPASGKTTLMTKAFANFKENGITCELIIEEARRYISELKFNRKMGFNDKLLLNDLEQKEIAERQFKIEQYMKHSCTPSTIIMSDSSTLNAGLYMSLDLYEKLFDEGFWYRLANNYDLLFYCHPLDNLSVLPEDGNRVHDLEQIRNVENRAQNLLKRLKLKFNGAAEGEPETPNILIHELLGSVKFEQKFNECCSIILNKQCDYVSRL